MIEACTAVQSASGSGESTITEPWLNVHQAAQHAGCGTKQLYRAVNHKRLKAARLGGRGDLRFRRQWIDSWLESLADPVASVS